MTNDTNFKISSTNNISHGGLILSKIKKFSNVLHKKINDKKQNFTIYKEENNNTLRIDKNTSSNEDIYRNKKLTNQRLTETFPRSLIEELPSKSMNNKNKNLSDYHYRTPQKRSTDYMVKEVENIKNENNDLNKFNAETNSGLYTSLAIIFGIIFVLIIIGTITYGIIKVKNKKKMDKKKKLKSRSSRRNSKKSGRKGGRKSKNVNKSRSKKSTTKSRSKNNKKSRSRKNKKEKLSKSIRSRTIDGKETMKINDISYPNGIQQPNLQPFSADKNIPLNPINNLQGNVGGYQNLVRQQPQINSPGVICNKNDQNNLQTPVIQPSSYTSVELPNVQQNIKTSYYNNQNQLDLNSNNKKDQNIHKCTCHYGMTLDQVIYISYGEDNWQKVKDNDTLSCFSFQIPSNYSINHNTM
ncbi:Hypothetical protein SRAE_2000127900 [Strongyloides ratti]|uniref:Uncharacterized protein n=1 Tax=Strongyloides ratti TaxID=34506 RepID=A0A090LA12_STRRB|nr:Hypothetical protein SRAE_2000127900 [Strongyloides ratti]CEF66611.1 Hypothetical protein SRAE_2000127900 [Strongyloides ratti]